MKAICTLKSYISNGGLIPLKTGNDSLGNLQDRSNFRNQVEAAIIQAEVAATTVNQQTQQALDAIPPGNAHGVFEGGKYGVVLSRNRQFTNTYVTNVNYSVSYFPDHKILSFFCLFSIKKIC